MSEDQILKTHKNTAIPKQHGGMMGGGPARAGMSLVEKPKNFWKTMSKLVGYLKPFWVPIILVFIFAIASTVFAILSPKILGNMTNQVVSDYINIKSYDQIHASLPKSVVLPVGITGAA